MAKQSGRPSPQTTSINNRQSLERDTRGPNENVAQHLPPAAVRVRSRRPDEKRPLNEVQRRVREPIDASISRSTLVIRTARTAHKQLGILLYRARERVRRVSGYVLEQDDRLLFNGLFKSAFALRRRKVRRHSRGHQLAQP